jgi:3-deoxy-D-manno-octulosonate 8-phosphate phosphatase (KDO 8-P phosphatase)
VLVGIQDKLAALDEFLEKIGIGYSEVCFVGDDIKVMKRVGKFFAPRDAHKLVVSVADEVCTVDGGRGVAREVAEALLLSAGLKLDHIYAQLIGNSVE